MPLPSTPYVAPAVGTRAWRLYRIGVTDDRNRRPSLSDPACPHTRRFRALVVAFAAAAMVLLAQIVASAEALTGVDLATYKRVGRHDLPEPTRTVTLLVSR
jgi:hypothetical protein